jgi:LPS export ABC transporter protein LptC
MINRFTILTVAALICFCSCENDMATIHKLNSRQEAQVEVGNDIEMLYSSDANLRARLIAPQVKHYNTKQSYMEFDKGLVVYFYDDSMKQTSKLTANYGRIDEGSNDMLVRDKVEVINVKNETLNTEELFWNNKTRRITSNKFVKIQTADEIIYGDGLDANEDMTNYRIKKISGTVKLKDGQAP